MHCTTSLNDVSAIAEQLDALPGGVHPMELVGDSVERWLHGAPSYGSGRTSHGPHLLVRGRVRPPRRRHAARPRPVPAMGARRTFFVANAGVIDAVIDQMLARDVDDDGLVESTIRLGNSGEHQWGTAWCDVLSFGWKDAWANAVLHEAWTALIEALPRVGRERLASDISARDPLLLVAAYERDVRRPRVRSRSAGWRSADGSRHDPDVFPLVNSNAVTSGAITGPGRVGRAMESVWAELAAVGFSDWRLGVPFDVDRVPDDDVAAVVYGLPLGCYLQGAASHHRLRVFVEALDLVGMTAESAALLDGLRRDDRRRLVVRRDRSGRDWRMWDGTPSGYEGQLVEGFSVLSCGLRRFGRPA